MKEEFSNKLDSHATAADEASDDSASTDEGAVSH